MDRLQTAVARRIAVLAGGNSLERQVSLASGKRVFRALREAGYHACWFDPAEQPLDVLRWWNVDACFIALHGGSGEDGTLQRQLEQWGIPFTGSGSTASQLAMTKSAAKERFLHAGLATPDYVLVHTSEPLGDVVGRAAALGYPIILKPDQQGSSLGVCRIDATKAWPSAWDKVSRFGGFALAESFVEGQELTVTLIDDEALPVLEIVTGHDIFDYRAKYGTSKPCARFASNLPTATYQRVQQVALRAAQALGTRGLVRVDLIVDRQQQPWLLEVNTIPGMTDHSLAPMAAAKAGMTMPALCDRLICQCLATEVSR